MKLEIESTTKLVDVVTETGAVVPARLWEGETDSGIPVFCYITRVQVRRDQDLSQFEAELRECRVPSLEALAIPFRMIL
jgi:hypothetical protein